MELQFKDFRVEDGMAICRTNEDIDSMIAMSIANDEDLVKTISQLFINRAISCAVDEYAEEVEDSYEYSCINIEELKNKAKDFLVKEFTVFKAGYILLNCSMEEYMLTLLREAELIRTYSVECKVVRTYTKNIEMVAINDEHTESRISSIAEDIINDFDENDWDYDSCDDDYDFDIEEID